MSSGDFHDRSGAVAGIATSIYLFATLPLTAATLLTIGGATGVIWLSPDIDEPQTNPSRRWLILSGIWGVYRATRGHRSVHWWRLFSSWRYRGHWPIFGSAERLLYLSFWPAVIAAIAVALVREFNPTLLNQWLDTLHQIDPAIAIAYLFLYWVGLEAACSFHILSDYLPLIRHDLKHL